MPYWSTSTSCSLIFSHHFISVKVVVNPESIPGALGVKWEYSIDWTPGSHRAPCTHIFTPCLPVHLQFVFERSEETGEPEGNAKIRIEHGSYKITTLPPAQSRNINIVDNNQSKYINSRVGTLNVHLVKCLAH